MFPIAHIMAPLFVLAIYDKWRQANGRKALDRWLYIIFGFAGILPDLLTIHLHTAERMAFSHSLFFPALLALLWVALKQLQSSFSVHAFLFAAGTVLHLFLDAIMEKIFPFFPLSTYAFDGLAFFPAASIMHNGSIYLHAPSNFTWYLFDLFFVICFLLVDKTDIVESLLWQIDI